MSINSKFLLLNFTFSIRIRILKLDLDPDGDLKTDPSGSETQRVPIVVLF